MNELKAAVIGMGKMGMLHAAILNSFDNVKVTAVADTEKFVLKFIEKNTSNIKVYTDYVKMLEQSDLDLVYIATPVHLHIKIAVDCAKRNLHFFVEKPLGRTSEDCESLCNIINEHNVVNMVGFYLRYSDTFSKAKELLDNGMIGEIKNVKCSVFQTTILRKGSSWRVKKEQSGGGVLIDLGVHLIDLLLWYFGKIKSVQGFTEYHQIKDVEDSVKVDMMFENGIPCSYEASWNVKNYRLQETTLEIEGTLGKIKVNEDYLKIEFNDPKKIKENSIFYKQTLYKGVPIDIGGPEYTNEDVDFINSIRNGKQLELNVLFSRNIHSVIDAIYKSSTTKKLEEVNYIE